MVFTLILLVISNFNFWINFIYFTTFKNKNLLLRMQYPSFTKLWVCIVFLFSSLKGRVFSLQGKWLFPPLPLSMMDISIQIFDYIITHECDLSFGLLSSSEIQTQAFVFSLFGGWQGGIGPWGCLPALKTTTVTTLTSTATTMTAMTTTTIAGR